MKLNFPNFICAPLKASVEERVAKPIGASQVRSELDLNACRVCLLHRTKYRLLKVIKTSEVN